MVGRTHWMAGVVVVCVFLLLFVSRAAVTVSEAETSAENFIRVNPEALQVVDAGAPKANATGARVAQGQPDNVCARCVSGRPCEYPNEVDLRILVLAFDRDESLRKCLDRIPALVLNEAQVAVDIWLDVKTDKSVHEKTYAVANQFATEWTKGKVCVHVQTEHSNVDLQWLFSWRPRPNSREMALIVEDDIELSPYAAQWLLLANRTFGDDKSVYAYTLQSENVSGQQPKGAGPMSGPPNHITFKMPIMGTWGFSPKGNFWRSFQDWYIETLSKNPKYKPYVSPFKNDGWYRDFEKSGREHTMAHEMWLTHFVHNNRNKLYCLYNNLKKFTGKNNVQLSGHRQESGLHYHGVAKSSDQLNLLMEWDPKYAQFDRNSPEQDEFGNVILDWDIYK
jgi:hypothetical protein